MNGESRKATVGESADFRTFTVEAWAGHRVCAWPFGRFSIGVSELRVRLSFPWFITRSQQADAIQAVVLTRRLGGVCWLRFEDTSGSLGDVRVHSPFRLEQIVLELRKCGYEVVHGR